MLARTQTELIYHYFDLSDQQQAAFVQQLTATDPSLAQQILPFLSLDNHNASLMTELLAQHATDIVNQHDALTDLSGQLLGKYKLSHQLGSGGFGVVYQAERQDQTFEQTLAIKVTKPRLQDLLGDGFIYQEAQMLARLNHPYIAKVYDGGRYKDLTYIVMEKVDGEPLNAFLDQHALSERAKLTLFTHLCQAIGHAHQSQVLHGDIKPENIMLQSDHTPKLLDFNGTAAYQEQHAVRAFSREFASPEQMEGAYLTNQSDIYSLGKLLMWLMASSATASPLCQIIAKATQEQLSERYLTVQALEDDVQAILTLHPTSFERPRLSRVLLRAAQRHPIRAAFSMLMIVLAIGFTTALEQKNRQLQREKAIAEQMMFEVTHMLFNSKGQVPLPSLLELTRRRVLANPELPSELKQSLLQAMLTPLPKKQQLNTDCLTDCQ